MPRLHQSANSFTNDKPSKATHPIVKSVLTIKQARNMTEDPNVAILIDGCRRRDEASQLSLYRHFYSYGMSISLRYASNRESALEMLNDGFLKVFLKIDQYDTDYSFRPWLRKIMVNAAIDHYRKYEQKKEAELLLPSDHPSTYNEALDQLEFDALLQMMKSLPPAYRMVFNLYVVENKSHAEIAEELGISVGASKSNLAKARMKIKKLISASQATHLKTKKYG